MSESLNESEMQTEITFGLIGERLSVRKVHDTLGLQSSRSFEKGDTYVGRQRREGKVIEVKRQRPRGVWQLSTASLLTSDKVADHAQILLEKLNGQIDAIRELARSDDLFRRVSICHVGSGSFELASDLLQDLSTLCDEVSITCWEIDEDD